MTKFREKVISAFATRKEKNTSRGSQRRFVLLENPTQPPSPTDSPGPKRGSEGETLSQLNPITQSVGWLYLPNPRHKEKMTDSWDLGFQDESILSLDRGGAETQLHGRSVGSEARGARPCRKKKKNKKEKNKKKSVPVSSTKASLTPVHLSTSQV